MKRMLKKTIFYKWYRWNIDAKNKKLAQQFESKNPNDLYCIGCNQNWTSFKPFPKIWLDLLKNAGWKYELDDAETLNLKHYSCYGCGITDRDRLFATYLQNTLNPTQRYDIIEFAPTPPLTQFLKNKENCTVRTSDLFMNGVDDKLDLQDLHLYKDNQFDVFICSHILEHVDDDVKAMKELFRITKSGGFGIVMVPIIDGVKDTHEDIKNKNEKFRIQHFGQRDHVRLYSKKDFISRLTTVGFTMKLLDMNHFGTKVFEKNAITTKSVLYIAEKK